MIGQTISHYRIIEKLGQGGMGEVYRAEDTSLHRHVAIKALPDVFAHDARRLVRFQCEAELLSSRNHSNVATLNSFEQSDGKRYVATDPVKGRHWRSLSWNLSRGVDPDRIVGDPPGHAFKSGIRGGRHEAFNPPFRFADSSPGAFSRRVFGAA